MLMCVLELRRLQQRQEQQQQQQVSQGPRSLTTDFSQVASSPCLHYPSKQWKTMKNMLFVLQYIKSTIKDIIRYRQLFSIFYSGREQNPWCTPPFPIFLWGAGVKTALGGAGGSIGLYMKIFFQINTYLVCHIISIPIISIYPYIHQTVPLSYMYLFVTQILYWIHPCFTYILKLLSF